MRLRSTLAALFLLVSATRAEAGPFTATVFLNGGLFIQGGSVTNDSDGGFNIVEVIYSLGTPADGIATWDTSTGGGTASGVLSDPRYFQTVTWSGLNVAPGVTFNFGGLDIDFIETLVPLSVSGGFLDLVGTSLANAFFSVRFNDGTVSTAPLFEQSWASDQRFQLAPGGAAVVPEPASLLLIGAGLALIARRVRRT